MLLNLWGKSDIPQAHRILIAYLFVAARMVIVVAWKSLVPPSLSAWRKRIWDLLIMDKIFNQQMPLNSDDYVSKFVVIWYPVITFIASNETTFQFSYSKGLFILCLNVILYYIATFVLV